MVLPSLLASRRYSGELPGEEPQNTHTLRTDDIFDRTWDVNEPYIKKIDKYRTRTCMTICTCTNTYDIYMYIYIYNDDDDKVEVNE